MITINNGTTHIRRELGGELVRHFMEDRLDQLDALPVKMRPRTAQFHRCCVYKDRAMIRYRLLALMGISIEQDDDETRPLTDFAHSALQRENAPNPVLTVIDMACSSCEGGVHRVTDLCRGCVARPCANNCPVDAITIRRGRAEIDDERCINCGKCQKVCPYNAVVYRPVPCEEQCPVGAIAKDETGRAVIDYKRCIFCGRCTRSCPFGAVMERSSLLDTARLLKQGRKTVACVAPSITGQYPGSMEQITAALHTLGFHAVLEVAAGADRTIREEAREFIHLQNEGQSIMGTSCCPAYTEAVRKHVPAFEASVSATGTPMFYTVEEARRNYPDHTVIFIGPCVAKKHEALRDSSADYVLTFEELGILFMSMEVSFDALQNESFASPTASAHARGFAAAGGVSAAVSAEVRRQNGPDLTPVLINGLNRKGLNMLKAAAAGKARGNLIEVMSCEGGCINGPGICSNPGVSRKKLKEYIAATAEKTEQQHIQK
ncbi:MAG: monomeric [FeFe] hydrogenase [Fibrobacterota bacterium]